MPASQTNGPGPVAGDRRPYSATSAMGRRHRTSSPGRGTAASSATGRRIDGPLRPSGARARRAPVADATTAGAADSSRSLPRLCRIARGGRTHARDERVPHDRRDHRQRRDHAMPSDGPAPEGDPPPRVAAGQGRIRQPGQGQQQRPLGDAGPDRSRRRTGERRPRRRQRIRSFRPPLALVVGLEGPGDRPPSARRRGGPWPGCAHPGRSGTSPGSARTS